MNVEEYISSGIVENYVLGLADEAEMAEFEQMYLLHPEVKAARISFENSIHEYAIQNAVTPPRDVLQSVLNEIGLNYGDGNTTPVVPITTETHVSYDSAKVISINNRFRNIAVAAVILLIASAILNFYFFDRYKDYSNRYTDLLASQTELVKNNQVIQAKMLSYEQDLNIVNDTNTVVIRMLGKNVPTSPAPASLATVYWNKQSKDVYIHINNMPHPSSAKQFQLWALVDGKPVDAGVFDINDNVVTVKMKNIPRAQAFAVTLEKTGGSEAPTMEQLYILGNV